MPRVPTADRRPSPPSTIAPPAEADSRGILRPVPGLRHFTLDRFDPPAALAPFVRWFWVVDWDQRDDEPFVQEMLPLPAVNLSIPLDGPGRINGVVTGRAVRTLEGRGQVAATLFRAAGFRPFVGGSMARFTDRIVDAREAMPTAEAWFQADRDAGDDALARVDAMVAFLNDLDPAPDAVSELVNEADERIRADVTLTRVARLAADLGIGERRLQRLFKEHVGVGPKWAIRRFRLQEAAERVAHGERVSWADVAADLGFADQAHLTRAFRATIGTTPDRYARECGT